jgi:hypothetical protein
MIRACVRQRTREEVAHVQGASSVFEVGTVDLRRDPKHANDVPPLAFRRFPFETEPFELCAVSPEKYVESR